jgi:hypothetical protein
MICRYFPTSCQLELVLLDMIYNPCAEFGFSISEKKLLIILSTICTILINADESVMYIYHDIRNVADTSTNVVDIVLFVFLLKYL